MTDPEMADATYVEPITPEIVAKIIEKERPDALLPTMGGQTGLNTALALDDMGVLEKFGVELIGAKRAAVEKAEDGKFFREAMARIGLENPRATVANTLADALAAIEHVGLPAIIRPAFTLGGTGGGVAYNREDFERICSTGLDASPVRQILIDESLLGWKEFEMEVVRDKRDNCIIVCSIENVDPMGVHTGDSVTVAPALTLTVLVARSALVGESRKECRVRKLPQSRHERIHETLAGRPIGIKTRVVDRDLQADNLVRPQHDFEDRPEFLPRQPVWGAIVDGRHDGVLKAIGVDVHEGPTRSRSCQVVEGGLCRDSSSQASNRSEVERP